MEYGTVNSDHFLYVRSASAARVRFPEAASPSDCCSGLVRPRDPWPRLLEGGTACSVPGAEAAPLAETEVPPEAVLFVLELTGGRPKAADLAGAPAVLKEAGITGLKDPPARLEGRAGRALLAIPVRIWASGLHKTRMGPEKMLVAPPSVARLCRVHSLHSRGRVTP